MPDLTDRSRAAESLFVSTVRMARRLRQVADARLTPSQHSVMMTIHKYGPLTLGEVAEWERVAQPTISRVVTRLESDGLVERTSDPNDGRVVRVGTTPAGAELFAEARARKVAWIDERLDLLGAQDRELIMAALPAMERLAALP